MSTACRPLAILLGAAVLGVITSGLTIYVLGKKLLHRP